jgi:5-formyltetrahydrofolate cyclo-ligase
MRRKAMTDPNAAFKKKAELRAHMAELLNKIDPSDQARMSQLAGARLTEQDAWQRACSVLFYAPLKGEVDLWPLLAVALECNKIVCLPWFDASRREYQVRRIRSLLADIHIGHYGIREPSSVCEAFALKSLDLLLVPGVAFDDCGRRLGRGKGYYDRLLTGVNGIKCGVGWDAQVCPEIPVLPHDIILDCILTPTRWLFAGPVSV